MNNIKSIIIIYLFIHFNIILFSNIFDFKNNEIEISNISFQVHAEYKAKLMMLFGKFMGCCTTYTLTKHQLEFLCIAEYTHKDIFLNVPTGFGKTLMMLFLSKLRHKKAIVIPYFFVALKNEILIRAQKYSLSVFI